MPWRRERPGRRRRRLPRRRARAQTWLSLCQVRRLTRAAWTIRPSHSSPSLARTSKVSTSRVSWRPWLRGSTLLKRSAGGWDAAISSSVASRLGWLALTWASRALPLSRAASNVFLTMEGVGGEQHAGQAQLLDHPLRRRDLVALDHDFAVRQQDRRLRSEGAQRLSRRAVGEVVEAALQGLAVERHDRHPSRLGRRQ